VTKPIRTRMKADLSLSMHEVQLRLETVENLLFGFS